MRRIAVICFGDVTNPVNGYHIRTRMLVEKLKGQGTIEVCVFQFSPSDSRVSKAGVEFISIGVAQERRLGSGIISKLLSFNPFSVLWFQLESAFKLRKLFKSMATFDEFYIEGCLLIGPFVLARSYRKPITLDTHCINKDVALKLKRTHWFVGSLRVVVWHLIEESILNRSDRVVVVSQNDGEFITKHYGIDPSIIQVLPNEVDKPDLERYSREAVEIRKQFDGDKIALFIGDLGAIHNRDAELFVRNTLAPQTPEVTYLFVGNNPKSLKDKENIRYTGFVDAIDPYIIMSDVCIAPLSFGGGTKTKVLDYIKYRKPVLATPIGAEGINDLDTVRICALDQFPLEIKAI